MSSSLASGSNAPGFYGTVVLAPAQAVVANGDVGRCGSHDGASIVARKPSPCGPCGPGLDSAALLPLAGGQRPFGGCRTATISVSSRPGFLWKHTATHRGCRAPLTRQTGPAPSVSRPSTPPAGFQASDRQASAAPPRSRRAETGPRGGCLASLGRDALAPVNLTPIAGLEKHRPRWTKPTCEPGAPECLVQWH